MIATPIRSVMPRSVFVSEFERRYRPVVIEGAAREWPAFGRWSIEWLAREFAERMVPVQDEHRRDYHGFRESPMKLGPYLRQMKDSREPFQLYLANCLLKQTFPELVPDIRVPEWIPAARTGPPRIWVSAPGTVTSTHLDFGQGCLTQLVGSKQVFLVAPKDAGRLYHPPFYSENWFYSPVELDAPDLKRFPRMRGVRVYHATLRAGDALFIPSRWRHFVRTVEESISINFFWYGFRERLLTRLSRLVGKPYT